MQRPFFERLREYRNLSWPEFFARLDEYMTFKSSLKVTPIAGGFLCSYYHNCDDWDVWYTSFRPAV